MRCVSQIEANRVDKRLAPDRHLSAPMLIVMLGHESDGAGVSGVGA
jgi:hypothetical protein